MTHEQALAVREVLGTRPLRYWTHTNEGMLIDREADLWEDPGAIGGLMVVDDPLNGPGVEEGIYKVMAHFATEQDRLEAERVFAPHAGPYEVINQGPLALEFTLKGVSKGSTALDLCLREGIDPAASVGIGDSGNDLSMIEVAGDGVAMGNASPEVKAAADHVAPPCTDSGVARYLEPLLG